MLPYVLLVIGFVLLVKGADIFVDGASALAKRLRVSELIIGLTIVAFGTSAPELVVNVMASLAGNSDIAFGNIVGSNIFNVFLILGVAGAIFPLAVKHTTTWKEIPFALLAALMLVVMANDIFLEGKGSNLLTRTDGLALLGFFAVFMVYIFHIAREERSQRQKIELHPYGPLRSVSYILLGLGGLLLGGRWVVSGASSIALAFGVSETVIGLSVVAIGTSLPELMTSAVAALKKSTDIAVGNVVGSNIFNVFLVLGVSSVIHPLPISPGSNIHLGVMLASTLLLFLFMFTSRKHTLDRWESVLFLGGFVSYLAFLFI